MLLDKLPVEILSECAASLGDQPSLASFCLTSRAIYPVAMRALYHEVKFESKRLDSSLQCASTILTNDLAASVVGELLFTLKLPIYSTSMLRESSVQEEKVFTTKMVAQLLERTPNLIKLVLQPAIVTSSELYDGRDTREMEASSEIAKEIFSDHSTRFQFSLSAFSTSLFVDELLLGFIGTHPKLTTFSTLFPIVPGTGLLSLGYISPDFDPLPAHVEKTMMPNLSLLCSFSPLAPFTFRILELLAPDRPLRAVFLAVPFWSHHLFKDAVPKALAHLSRIPTLRYLSFMGYLADFICIMQELASAQERPPFLALQFLVYDSPKALKESEMEQLLNIISTFTSVRFIAFYEVTFGSLGLLRVFSKATVNPETMFIFTDTYGEVDAQGPGLLAWKQRGKDGGAAKRPTIVDVSSDTIEEIRRLSYQATNEEVYLNSLDNLYLNHTL